MELYPWQNQCMDIWKANHTKGIIHVATGAGKTWFALYAAASLMENYADRIQIRIVVPTCALASQWKKEILRIFPNLDIHDIGMWQGELK